MKLLNLWNMAPLPYGSNEAMNRLRINLDYCGTQYKKIMITSSVAGEGKSFVSINLWRKMAESGKRVLLIDADIRKSALKSRYCLFSGANKSGDGLVNYLAGHTELDSILYATNIDGAYIIPVLNTVSNAAILLTNDRFPRMIKTLENSFDYIFIDTPPLCSVADGLQIAKVCDGSIVVVHSGETPRQLVSNTLKQLESIDCPVIGTVLNQVKTKNTPYYYRYYEHENKDKK